MSVEHQLLSNASIRFTYDHNCIEYMADSMLDEAYAAVRNARNMLPKNHINYSQLNGLLNSIEHVGNEIQRHYRVMTGGASL